LATLDPDVGPIELCNTWFDDLLPCLHAEHTLCRAEKAIDVSTGASFRENEWRIFTAFHQIFAANVDALPTPGEWRDDPGGKAVSSAAGAALAGLS
jgi:hypothetical protein